MGKKNFAPAVAVPGDISLADIDLWLCFKIAPVLILNFLFDVYQVLRWNVTLEIPEMWSVRKPNIVCRTLFTLRAVLLQTPSPSGSPRRWPTGCSFWDSRRRHRCTSVSFGTHRGCRGTFSGTEPRSKTCCVAASPPSCPSPSHPAWTQTSRIAGGSCTWTGAMCIRYREQAHASPVAVEEVSLKGRSAGFLIVPVTLGFVLIVPVSDVYHWPGKFSNVHVYLLQLYQELPCGSQGPRHTQQKSAWMSGLAKIWEKFVSPCNSDSCRSCGCSLHPSQWWLHTAFSGWRVIISFLNLWCHFLISHTFGHSLVLAEIQLLVSLHIWKD